MIRPALALALCPALPLAAAGVSAPLDYFLPVAAASYDSALPTPEAFLGFAPGDWHLRNDQIAAYVRELDRLSDRITVTEIGRTHEAKPLLLAVITSPENHRRLDAIREQHLALLDPARSAALDPATMPVVINLGYSIHGNEPSGANAVPFVVYHLAAARDAETLRTLREAVILLEPVRNPDGLDRFAHWANTNRGIVPVADPAAREHNETWPGGRTNHYGFDANRDWLPLVHPEARARNELFHRWRPNILTDHHEMGVDRTFFFQPGVPTRINPNTPPWNFDLTTRIAEYHAATLDEIGAFYYTKEGYDDFYIGKGSTYPDLHGTIGILFEQASSRGHLQRSEGDLAELPFAYTIRNHVRTSFSSLRAAIALRGELLEKLRAFPRETQELAQRDAAKAWVFDDAGDPARGWHFRDLLRQHRIAVHTLARELTIGEHTYRPGRAWLVPVNQPQYRLLTEMFRPRTEFADPVFYDISTWTLPPAFGITCDPVTDAATSTSARGAPVEADPFPTGRLVGDHGNYAYLLDWTAYYAPRTLQRLHDAGITTRVCTRPVTVTVGGERVTLGYGTVLIPVGTQRERSTEIQRIIDTAVREDAVALYNVSTGLATAGIDLGSPSVPRLKPPRVALVTGDGVDAYDAAEVWHLLDTRIGLGVTRVEHRAFGRLELGEYTAVVLVDGTYSALTDSAVEALKRWIRDGGTLLAFGRAAEWAVRKEIIKADMAAPKSEKSDAAPERIPYADGPDREALKLVSGAIFATTIDVTHPLGYGYTQPHLPVFRTNRLILKPASSPYETPAAYENSPLLSGYVSDENMKVIARSAAIVALPTGDGCVILAPDNLNFRGYWFVGNRAFLNALYFGSVIRTIGTDGGAE